MTRQPATRGWLDAIAVYADRRLVAIFFMGFSSGLPLLLTGWTLGIWLAEVNVSLAAIGFFALAGLSYNLKFLWAPIMDRAPIPVLTRWLGRRRSWALVSQVALIASLLAIGHSDPGNEPWLTALFAVFVAFFSASQDIVVDAFRIELLEDHEQGHGAASTQVGYRIGTLIAGAGALYIAEFYGWVAAYEVMAACVIIGMAAVLLTAEPVRGLAALEATRHPDRPATVSETIREAVIDPFTDFMKRNGWLVILLFILLYKVGDAFLGIMAGPFYVAMDFTKVEIASVTKIFGFAASVGGVFLGGVFVYRYGIMKALLICGILQAFSNLIFAAQAIVGHDVSFLFLTIGIENFSGGMGSAAFVAYLSSLCNVAFTATQYALLTSLMAVPRTVLSSSGGIFAEQLGWAPFFVFTTIAALPGLVLLVWMMRRYPVPDRAAAEGAGAANAD